MFPIDYDRAFKHTGKSVIDKDGVLHVEMVSKDTDVPCPVCGSKNTKKHAYQTRTGFMDVTEAGQPVEITLKLRRRVCHDCVARKTIEDDKSIQTTYIADSIPACMPPNRKISTDVIDAVIKMVAQERISVAKAAESLHIGPTTASKIIDEQCKAAWDNIATLEPPDVLTVFPFIYGKKERCAILGAAGDRPMLYAILDDCDASTVYHFLFKTTFEDELEPCVALTDYPRPDLHKSLSDLYEEVDIGILRESTRQKLHMLGKRGIARKISAEVYAAISELRAILSAHFYDRQNNEFIPVDTENEDFYESLPNSDKYLEQEIPKNFEIMLSNWWNGLSPAAKTKFQSIYDGIVDNQDKIKTALQYTHDQYDPATLLQCIVKLRDDRVPYQDLMSRLALAAGVHNKENISAVEMLSSSYVPKPIHRFYIDLIELNAILGDKSK